jgi:hypothetical protein
VSDQAIRDLYEEHGPLVARIAKREHKGAMTVTVEDVEQAIWLFMFENIRHLTGYTAPGITDLATKSARKYLLQERIDYMHFMGNFIYTPEIVETYLKDAVWSNVEDVPDIDGRVDVTDEFNKLPLATRKLMFKKYALGEPPASADSTGRSTIDRAVVRITNNLNLKLHQTKVENENV